VQPLVVAGGIGMVAQQPKPLARTIELQAQDEIIAFGKIAERRARRVPNGIGVIPLVGGTAIIPVGEFERGRRVHLDQEAHLGLDGCGGPGRWCAAIIVQVENRLVGGRRAAVFERCGPGL